ncbi:MAG: hypothetical protein K6U87_06075 [Firmicutes bacterium]|nr:hypothetical protein [Bacillota bacterium]
MEDVADVMLRCAVCAVEGAEPEIWTEEAWERVCAECGASDCRCADHWAQTDWEECEVCGRAWCPEHAYEPEECPHCGLWACPQCREVHAAGVGGQ